MKNLLKSLILTTLIVVPIFSCDTTPQYSRSFSPTLQSFNANVIAAPAITGYIWYDKDLDGLQDYGEIALQKIRVKLYKDGQDINNTVETDENGIYRFENLEPNHKYYIEVLLPKNYKGFTFKDVGDNDTIDSDVDGFGKSDEIELKEGEIVDIDAGLLCRCVAWIDIEKYTNGEDADYEKDAPVLKVGDSVTWKYVVSNSSSLKVCDIKVIDNQEGEIECPSDCVDPGSEMVCTKEGVVKEGPYKNMATVSGTAENNETVTDEDPSNYVGENNLGCIGNYYWYDENLNGLQDSNEPGIIGIKVELYDENKNLLATTKTDNSGKYLFCNLESGNYYVKFDLPDTYLFTLKDKGSDLIDSDANSDGWSHLIEFDATQNDLTIDAGIYCSCDDYLVHPENYDSDSAFISSKFMLILISILALFAFKRDRL